MLGTLIEILVVKIICYHLYRRRRTNGDQSRKFGDVSRHASDLWTHGAYERRYEEAKLKYNGKRRRLSEEIIVVAAQDASNPDKPMDLGKTRKRILEWS